MKLTGLIIATLVGVEAGKNKEQKLKDKKSRLLRNLRKEAPVALNNEGAVIFDDDALGMQCLTSSGDYENLGQLNHDQARVFICQSKSGIELTQGDCVCVLRLDSRNGEDRCFLDADVWHWSTHR